MNNKKLTLEELKSLVFHESQATKRNKDRLFKLAKAEDDIKIIKRLRDDFGFKSAKVYLNKLDHQTLEKAIKNRDIKLFKEFVKNGTDISTIKIADLIDKKYDDEFIQIFIEKGYYVNVAQLTKKHYKANIIKFALDNGAK